LAHVDSDASNGIDSLNNDQTNYLLQELCRTEQSIAAVTININRFVVAEEHCQRYLTHSNTTTKKRCKKKRFQDKAKKNIIFMFHIIMEMTESCTANERDNKM
jgi:hypothetical protein